MSTTFIGREQELESLGSLLKKKIASLVILKGRRRIGKSRLIDEFAKQNVFDAYYVFTGIPPVKTSTAQSERDEFASQLSQTGLPDVKVDDWNKLFHLLSEKTNQGRVLLLFDEISWMGSKDPDFLGKLKNAWDLKFSQNPKLILVLCGSVSAWIEKHIVESTGFLGRPSLYITLQELALNDCANFWNDQGKKVSNYEKLKVLSVTGGVPRYLELIDPSQTAEKIIKNLCFTKSSPLLNEFDFIFNDIFSKRSEIYKHIVNHLAQGSKDQEELSAKSGLTRSGDLTDYLNELALSGFIARDYTWHLKTGQVSKLSKYRLKDNYVRFYMKYLRPNKPKIENGLFDYVSLGALPAWDSIVALQFENLVINNHFALIRAIGIPSEEIIFANPFFQRKTARQAGCQIDYVIQTKFGTIYVCEIKFSRFEIGQEIINEVEKKIARLSLPRHFSVRPVIIHVNGVREDVIDSGYFSASIDFGKLLEQ